MCTLVGLLCETVVLVHGQEQGKACCLCLQSSHVFSKVRFQNVCT